MSASLIGRLGSSGFRPSTPAVSMSLAGRASLRNRHLGRSIMGFEDEGNNLYRGLACEQVQADIRTHLIHRPARDIIPPLSGARVFSYRIEL